MPTATQQPTGSADVQRWSVRRLGYVVAAVVNAVMLWVAHQLLDWGWPGFLTASFDDVLPVLTVSFVVSIAVNLVFAWRDTRHIKAGGDLVTSSFGLLVAVRAYRVFPVDFSDHDSDWSWAVRLVLVVAIIGSVIGVIASLFTLLTPAEPD